MAGLTTYTAPMAGTVAALPRTPGAEVAIGAALVIVEAMKMEHPVAATEPGTLVELLVAVGDLVAQDQPVATVRPGDGPAADETRPAATGLRADLALVRERQALLADAARPEAVARRHASGARTIREDVADLLDPGSFVEYGGLAVAAQRARRSEEELRARTPADGLVCGIGRVDGLPVAVVGYDYTVLAGTQGRVNHQKKDRFFEVIERLRLPVVLFAEGGGGRPGDTDHPGASWLDNRTFTRWARLSGLVPRVAIVRGRCFAGNAALAGCSDLIVAVEGASLGMAGPAMIAGGGLGEVAPDDVGPVAVQEAAGVLDVVVADQAAAVAVARDLLGVLAGPAREDWACADQELLRDLVPEGRREAYDVRTVVAALADTGSVVELRPRWAPGIVTSFARLEGRPVGVLASNPMHLGGAVTSEASDKAARFLQLCDAFGVPVVSLVDTPGFMVGPEAEHTGLVRHTSRLFVVGASLSVPVVAVVLRKAYGLGAQALLAGGLLDPLLVVCWPTGELGPMGLEGAIQLGFRRELEEAGEGREALYDGLVAEAYRRAGGLNVAAHGEVDDVIDPADTRRVLLGVLSTQPARLAPPPSGRRRMVDTW